MEDQVSNFDVALAEINCGQCGGVYAINEKYRRYKYQNGGHWNCPYCKVGWGYGESQNDKLKTQLEREKKRREWAQEDARKAGERAAESERRRVAQKAATTRLKNRASAGLCPCCNRHFKQLSNHMKNKHPEFKLENKSVEK